MVHKQAATTNKGTKIKTTLRHIHTCIHFTSLPILCHLASGENIMKEDEEEDVERTLK